MSATTTSSSYKLTYFNGRGKAEVIRLVFAAAGVQFEDVRLDMEKWTAVKPSTPFGQLPTLEMDGVVLCQSNTIARFLARRFNLAGKTDLDQARADMFIDCFEDVTKLIFPFYFYEKDETKKETLKKKFLDEQLPTFLGLFEKLLVSNGGGDGFLVGSEMTWADLGFIQLANWVVLVGAESQLTSHQKLAALRQRVEKLPKIAEWIAKRPVTDY